MENKIEIICGALDGHFSVARFSGGCTYNGQHYDWRYDMPDHYRGVLVRRDISKKLNTEQLEQKIKDLRNGSHSAA